jgi:hypothetical protein
MALLFLLMYEWLDPARVINSTLLINPRRVSANHILHESLVDTLNRFLCHLFNTFQIPKCLVY